MSMVLNYYTFGTSDIDDILYNLKDKLSENGWTIDYDKISTEGKLAFHVTDTQCYYTIRKNPDYAILDQNKESHFHPYLITGNTGVDTGTWYEPTLGDEIYESNSSYFVITNSYCLTNDKFCSLILEGYSYRQSDYPFCLFYMFGQLEIPNENQQGNFLWVTPASGYEDGSWRRLGCDPSNQLGVYYKDTLCKPGTIESYDDGYLFYGLGFKCISEYEKDYPVSFDKCFYGYLFNNSNYWTNPPSDCDYLPFLGIQPYQFGRLYLRTLIVYHKYELSGVTYIHPIAETPFYLCKYRGIEWYNKTITYNTRKFKVYPLGHKGINYEHEFGVAFEVGNL